jgi:hypothetical protein
VRRQFAEANAPDAALVIRSVQVGGPLRGDQDLAAWMVSQVIHRKLPTANGFALMRADSGDVGHVPAVRDAQGSLPSTHDWRRTGLTPLQGHPRYLGQSTNGPALDIARAGLGGADRFRIRVHVNDVERLTRGG